MIWDKTVSEDAQSETIGVGCILVFNNLFFNRWLTTQKIDSKFKKWKSNSEKDKSLAGLKTAEQDFLRNTFQNKYWSIELAKIWEKAKISEIVEIAALS